MIDSEARAAISLFWFLKQQTVAAKHCIEKSSKFKFKSGQYCEYQTAMNIIPLCTAGRSNRPAILFWIVPWADVGKYVNAQLFCTFFEPTTHDSQRVAPQKFVHENKNSEVYIVRINKTIARSPGCDEQTVLKIKKLYTNLRFIFWTFWKWRWVLSVVADINLL